MLSLAIVGDIGAIVVPLGCGSHLNLADIGWAALGISVIKGMELFRIRNVALFFKKAKITWPALALPRPFSLPT